MRPLRLLVALLVAVSAAAQESRSDQEPGGVATTIVPVVGNLFGASMVRWVTDVDVVNDTGLPVEVAIELPMAPGSPAIFLALAPGQAQRFPDVVRQAFGLETALSPLRITSGSRRPLSVLTNVYATWGTEVSPLQPIPAESGPFFPTRILDGLAFSEEQRTNIGLVNLSEGDADFLVALQRIPGRSVAVTHVRVPPLAMVHQAIQALFPLITEGTGFGVVVETSTADTIVYASVVESGTQRGRFVPARVGVR